MAFLLWGGFSSSGLSLPSVLFISLLGLGMLRHGLRRPANASADAVSSFLSGLAALTAVFALVQVSGALSPTLYPAIYAVVAFLVTFNAVAVGTTLVATAMGYEIALFLTVAPDAGRSATEFVSHLVLLLLFGGLHLIFDTVGRQQRQRASSAPLDDAAASVGQVTQAQNLPSIDVEALFESAVMLAEETCNADACFLLQLDVETDELVVVAASELQAVGARLAARAGLAGGVAQTGQPVIANNLRPNFPGTFSDPTNGAVAHALAAPIGEERVSGVLLVQRYHGSRFGEGELARLDCVADLLYRAQNAHRHIARITDAHDELERFVEASRLLNSALTPEEVYESADEALGLIVDAQFTAVTWIQPDSHSHRVVHTSGSDIGPLVGTGVDGEVSLATMVVKNGHYLPLGCEFRRNGVPILSRSERVGRIKSVLVLPLRMHDTVLGTLTVGSSGVAAFPDQRRGMLEVIANQVAVSLTNARTYAKVQEMATIDALTGLHNQRVFKGRLGDAMARALRSQMPLSLLMLDIDHFKRVNDSYGHPTGDVVLKGLGALIKNLMRRTDTAARNGGEEFAIILEHTDLKGALVMAERLREEANRISFTSPEGVAFNITLSLGVASYPRDAEECDALIEAADQALYSAKRSGRNRTRVANRSESPEGIQPSLWLAAQAVISF